ncbi:MAG TPA: hypothetical protein VMY05_07970 [Acidobacteriota bacterium]|nr:hypothetical protein [Acidobacteriota bacterium]
MTKHFVSRGIVRPFLGLITVILLIADPARAEPDDPGALPGCYCVGMVGNVDCDYADIVDVGDLTFLIDYLFISHARLPNREEANTDGDPDGVIDIGDLTALIDHLFITHSDLPPCPAPPNCPPRTKILYFPVGPYIDAPAPGSPVTGIPISWEAFDLVDHPYYPPPFECEWRLYGPYVSDTIHDSTWEELTDRFIKPAFRCLTGEVYLFGEGGGIIVCDSVPVPIGDDSVGFVITCDTVFVDTITGANVYGWLDTVLDVDDPDFVDDPLFDRVALRSQGDGPGDVWVFDLTDTLYDVYRYDSDDTTREEYFIFWVRARDVVDSNLYDPTPDFKACRVIDPRYEHDVGILDLQQGFSINACIRDSARAFWDRALDSWAGSSGLTIDYEPTRDYRVVNSAMGIGVTLREVLAYKTVVFVDDNVLPGCLAWWAISGDVLTVIDAGVNAWMCGRTLIYGDEAAPPQFDVFSAIPPNLAEGFSFYFGVEQMVFSGWEWHIYFDARMKVQAGCRIEDFIGAHSYDEEQWPDLTVDSALLHRRYRWEYIYPWVDTLAAMPEVDWYQLGADVQPMYSYASLYPGGHFLGPEYTFEGRDVAHRLNRGLFRTAFFMFTPFALEESAAQTVIDTVLSWLYDPYLVTPPLSTRYTDAPVPVNQSQVRERYFRRLAEQENDAKREQSLGPPASPVTNPADLFRGESK